MYRRLRYRDSLLDSEGCREERFPFHRQNVGNALELFTTDGIYPKQPIVSCRVFHQGL